PVSTDAIHAGWDPAADGHRALTPPVHTASAYAQTSHAALKALFQRRASGYAYSRSGNPTTSVLEQRISALERGTGAIAVASGQAATTIALFALAAPGGHVVASTRLYGAPPSCSTTRSPTPGCAAPSWTPGTLTPGRPHSPTTPGPRSSSRSPTPERSWWTCPRS